MKTKNQYYILTNAVLKKKYNKRFILRSHIRNILNNSPKYKYKYINQVLTKEYKFKSAVFNKNKQIFCECLGYINRYYVAIVRFQRKFRLRKMKVFDIQETLECEPMESIPENEKIKIVQNNTLYTFYVNDFMSLFNNALLHVDYIMVLPRKPKNPYNNMEFTQTDLYNFYIHMRLHNQYWNQMVWLYYKLNMDTNKFYYKNMVYLREYGVKEYIRNEEPRQLMYEIVEMFEYIYMTHYANIIPVNFNIHIHILDGNESYYKKILNYTRILLFHYIMIINNNDTVICEYHTTQLVHKFNLLIQEHPNFWRRHVRASVGGR